MPKISFCVNPSFANSNCNSLTSEAVNLVVAPNSFDCSVNDDISSLVTPKTEAKFAEAWSKSFMTPNTSRMIIAPPIAKPKEAKAPLSLPSAFP